jgi:hypothetical protein
MNDNLGYLRDLLFLDLDGTAEFYNLDKWQNSSAVPLDEVVEAVRGLLNMESVRCNLCGRSVWADEARLHQDEWIGACCWDERLRASE